MSLHFADYLQLSVPDWPYFNRHPLEWLPDLDPPKEDNTGDENRASESASTQSKAKKTRKSTKSKR